MEINYEKVKGTLVWIRDDDIKPDDYAIQINDDLTNAIKAIETLEKIDNWVNTDEAIIIAELVHKDGIDSVKEACAKQIFQKPIKGQDRVTNFCPTCLLKVDGQLTRPIVGYAGTQFFHHCPWCGQKLDWGKQNVIS